MDDAAPLKSECISKSRLVLIIAMTVYRNIIRCLYLVCTCALYIRVFFIG